MRHDLRLHAEQHAPAQRLPYGIAEDLDALLLPSAQDPLEKTLVEIGLTDPACAARRLRAWRADAPLALQSVTEQDALNGILPMLLEQLARFEDPDATLAALDEILGRLPDHISLFAPFRAEPGLMRSVLNLLGHAPNLSRYLVAQPHLIRRLIDATAYAPLPSTATLDAEFGMLMRSVDRNNGARRFAEAVGAYRFGIGVQLLEARTDALDAAAAQCDLAEAALRAAADDAITRIADAHGVVPGAELVIVALGGFGGRALTHASDLDLVYLFTGDSRAQSDGRKPLDANEYFSRIAQQITAAMSTVTTLGPLYEIDTRLRPWGAKGLLACSTETFERYHADNAWTWEHMALTRARPIYGSEAARATVRTIISRRLRTARDRDALLADAIKMRGDIARHKPAKGLFDVKLIEGGMVDLEFIIQVRQLDCHVGIDPRLGRSLRSLVAAGLVAPELIDAHAVLGRLLTTLRLLSPGGHGPAPERRATIATACGFRDWAALLGSYARARAVVRATWEGIAREGNTDRD